MVEFARSRKELPSFDQIVSTKFSQSIWFFILWVGLLLPGLGISDDSKTGENKADNSCFELKSDSSHTEIDKIYKIGLETFKIAEKAGLCSWDASEAIETAYEIVMGEGVDDSYSKGDANHVYSNNFGLINYFSSIAKNSSEFSKDSVDLLLAIKNADSAQPMLISEITGQNRKASISAIAKFNSYELALKMKKQNVFKAITSLGSVGHDDTSLGLPVESSLFARQNLGPDAEISPDVLTLYQDASKECIEFSRPAIINSTGSPVCGDAGVTNNYHMIAGFYLGCQLAKQGFETVKLPKHILDNPLVRQIDGGYFSDHLKLEKHFPVDQYRINVCTDLPAALGYTYKKTTMPVFLSQDAKIIYKAGYSLPFLYRDRKFKKIGEDPFKSWSEERLKEAVGNLDLNLALLQYRSAQHRAGAEKGARVCREYKEKVKPEALRPESLTKLKDSKVQDAQAARDAAVLYDLGYFSLNLKVGDLKRHRVQKWSTERKGHALKFLQDELRKMPLGIYDYTDEAG